MDLGGMDTPPLKIEPAEDAGDAGSGGSLNLELLREFARRLQTRQPDTSAGAGDRPESPEPDQALRGPFVPPQEEGECDLRMVWSPHRSTRWRRATEPSLVPYPEWAQTLELNRARDLTSSPVRMGPDLIPPVGPAVVARTPPRRASSLPEFEWQVGAARPRLSRERAIELLAQIREDWPDLLPAEAQAQDPRPATPAPPTSVPPLVMPPEVAVQRFLPAWVPKQEPQEPMGMPQVPQYAGVQPTPLQLQVPAPQRMPFFPQAMPTSAGSLPLMGEPQVSLGSPQMAPFSMGTLPQHQPRRAIRGPRRKLLFTCAICGKVLSRRTVAEKHIEREHWGRMFRCLACGCQWTRRGDCKNHQNKLGHVGVDVIFSNLTVGQYVNVSDHLSVTEDFEDQPGPQSPKQD